MKKFLKSKKIGLVLLPVFWPGLPPLSLAALKGTLSKNGFNADVLDLNNLFFNSVSEKLRKEWMKSCNSCLENNILEILHKDHKDKYSASLEKLLKYEILGFSCYKSNMKNTLKMAKDIRRQNSDCKIILGGPEVTAFFYQNKEYSHNDFIDSAHFLVSGEGELPLLDILKKTGNKNLSFSFYECDHLQDLGKPDYKDFDWNAYPKKKAVSLLSSRGCIRKCRFCSERLLYKKFRIRPVSHIICEIKKHREKGIEYFIFHDSMFNADLGFLENFCDEITARFGKIKWEAQMAIRQDMPISLFKKINKSGCYHLFIGLESGCDHTLKKMNKGFDTQDAVLFFKKLKESGLSFGVSIITGFPGETEQDFMMSLNFILRHKSVIPKIEQVNPFVYYPGTPLPEKTDYRYQPGSVKRAQVFVKALKEHGIKHTNAFVLNLIDKEKVSAWK